MSGIGKLVAPLAMAMAMVVLLVVVAAGTGRGTIMERLPLPGTAPVVEAASQAQNSTPIREALQPLGNKFVRAFHFDNTTKSWLFYDPREPVHSNLETLETNKPYYIKVSESVKVTLNGRERNLTCANGDCWNQIGW